MHWLAYAHPALMVCVLSLGLFVFREGLRNRRARREGRPFDSRRHRRAARVFLALIALGFVAGLASMGGLRGEPLFGSLHAYLALSALVSFGLAGILGLRLERRGELRTRGLHAALGALGLLLGLAAGVAGFSILP